MASNDLMMRIRLLVDSGRATRELQRMESAIKGLRDQVSSLESARIAPLSKQIEDLGKSAAQLKNVNLGNFATQIDTVKRSFESLGVGTEALTRLNDAYRKLSTAKASDEIGRLGKELKKANLELEGVRASAKSGILFTSKNTFFDLGPLKSYDNYLKQAIKDENDGIRAQRKEIVNLKSELRSLGSTYQSELRAAGKQDISSLNRQLREQKADLISGQQGVKLYSGELRVLRDELRRLRDIGKQISAKEMIESALPASKIKTLGRELETSSSALKTFKDNLKLIQNSNLTFRVSDFGDARSIATVRNEIARLKDEIKAASVVKFDPRVATTITRIGDGLRGIGESRSFNSLKQFNDELTVQQQGLLKAQNSIRSYRDSLSQLRLEASRAAVPDFTVGGTRNLVKDLNDVQASARSLRTRELLPLQNELRDLQSGKSFQKALAIAPLDAAVKRLRAEIPDIKSKLELATTTGNLADVAKFSTQIAAKKEEIIQKELRSAQLNEAMVNTLGKQIANSRSLSNDQKNRLSLLGDEEKNIKSLIASERQRAKESAQSVKTGAGGILDTTALKNQQSALADIYKSNIASLKQYHGELKRGSQEEVASLASRLNGLNSELTAVKSLESRQKSAIDRKQRETEEIKNQVKAEEERYRNLARLGQLQNQNEQKLLADRIKARDADLQSSKTSVDGIKQRIAGTKEEIASIKESVRAKEDSVRSSIAEAQQRIATGQLTRQQLQEERASVREQVSAQKELSRIYQDNLKSNADGLKIALQGETARVQAIKTQIKELAQLSTAQARERAAELQSDLRSAKASRGDLASRIREIEQEAKAEVQRINSLDASTRALGRQNRELTTLGRLFRGGSGVAREFGAALRFALGPQMAGFAAAGSIIQLISGFFAANKEIENLNRGLNSITGAGTLYFEELRRIANSTGQSLLVVTDSFLQLVAASKGTRLEGEATRRIFESVSRALVVTGADAVRSRRAFLALAQMMSKGQIYAEELRQQLSEALPGAVQIFSRALDISPQKLLGLMKQGKVSADALILFMQQLEKEVPKVGEDLFTFSQKSALLQNELQRLFVEIGKTGIWRALGDALLDARDFIGDLANGTGAFGDAAKREIGSVIALFKTLEFSGVDVFGGLIDGLKRFVSEFSSGILDAIKQIPSLINESLFALKQITIRVVPEIDQQKLDKLAKDLQEFGNRALLAGDLDRALGLTFDELARKWEDFTKNVSKSLPLPSFEQWRREGGAAFNAQIRDLKELEGILQNKLGRRVDWFGADEEEAKKIAQHLSDVRAEIAGVERQSVQSFEASKKAIEDHNKALSDNLRLLNEQKKAESEIGQNTEFLKGFDPRARDSINKAYTALSNYQRAAETVLRLEKESDQAILEKVKSSKKVLDVQNEITDATIRATEAQKKLDQNRAKDATDLLSATLSQADAVRQAEENSKKLRQGRQEAGIYFTPDQKKASEDEARAMKLRSQAQDDLAKASKETNQEIKDGYLENAKLLLEQSSELLVNAGNTYLLKQNNEELLSIQKQLNLESKAKRENDEKAKRGLELLAQAQKLFNESQGADIPASVRDEYLNNVDDIAKKAQSVFADIGLFDKLKESSAIRTDVAKALDESAGELQKKISEGLVKFNEQTKLNAEEYYRVLSKLGPELVNLQSELQKKMNETVTEAARSQLKGSLDDLRLQLNTFNLEYQQIFKRLQDAGKNPTEIGFIKERAKLPVDADTSKAEESVDNTIKKINEKEATLDVNVRYNDPGFSNGNVSGSVTEDIARRWGGPIPGYGGGDRVRALLEPGEFVLRKEAVRSIGIERLFEMNRKKRFPRAPRVRDGIGIPRMANGGMVPGSPITINVPGKAPIRLSGSRDQAEALANLLTGVGRAL